MRHLPSTIVIYKQELGVQPLIESHRFKLTLTQTGNRNDEFMKVNFDNSLSEIILESICFRLAGDCTFPENGGGHTNVLEKVVEKRQSVTNCESDQRRSICDDQHQACFRKAASSARRSSGG